MTVSASGSWLRITGRSFLLGENRSVPPRRLRRHGCSLRGRAKQAPYRRSQLGGGTECTKSETMNKVTGSSEDTLIRCRCRGHSSERNDPAYLHA